MTSEWAPGHEPGEWMVVHSGPRTVVLSAMCRCGDDECAFTLAPDPRAATQVGPYEPTGTAGGVHHASGCTVELCGGECRIGAPR